MVIEKDSEIKVADGKSAGMILTSSWEHDSCGAQESYLQAESWAGSSRVLMSSSFHKIWTRCLLPHPSQHTHRHTQIEFQPDQVSSAWSMSARHSCVVFWYHSKKLQAKKRQHLKISVYRVTGSAAELVPLPPGVSQRENAIPPRASETDHTASSSSDFVWPMSSTI